MSKTFRYTKLTGHYYCMASDEWEQDGVDFDYEVEDDKLLPKIVDLVFKDYFKSVCNDKELKKSIKAKIKDMIDENELIEKLSDQYEDTLKEIFEKEALEWYND